MSDVAHSRFGRSSSELRSMRPAVFAVLELDDSARNYAVFEFCVSRVAFEGTNVSLGRLVKLMREFGADPEFCP